MKHGNVAMMFVLVASLAAVGGYWVYQKGALGGQPLAITLFVPDCQHAGQRMCREYKPDEIVQCIDDTTAKIETCSPAFCEEYLLDPSNDPFGDGKSARCSDGRDVLDKAQYVIRCTIGDSKCEGDTHLTCGIVADGSDWFADGNDAVCAPSTTNLSGGTVDPGSNDAHVGFFQGLWNWLTSLLGSVF